MQGNTSTDVEKTGRLLKHRTAVKKHLHGRGEDHIVHLPNAPSVETPPRTWRRPPRRSKPKFGSGNTSTDVEKTNTAKSSHAIAEKHLHGRGEDSVATEPTHSFSETPPRTWRRLINESKHVFSFEKHLHGRGEDPYQDDRAQAFPETPPRTWRRQHVTHESLERLGNTSTDVEKTRRLYGDWRRWWKHLHGRGEDSRMWPTAESQLETPPRTWRRLELWYNGQGRLRNTSTDVEKTFFSYVIRWCLRKHLHGRGEDLHGIQKLQNFTETPPRTWRRLPSLLSFLRRQRNTSTDVEKTESHLVNSGVERKHLHGRGEDYGDRAKPPTRVGNTSTDVEKTVPVVEIPAIF